MNLGHIAEANHPKSHVRKLDAFNKAGNNNAALLNLREIVRRLRKEYITRTTGNAWRKMIYAEIKKKNGITWAKLGTNGKELKKLIDEAVLCGR